MSYILTNTIKLSGLNQNPDKMTEAETHDIVKEVKDVFDKMTQYSERAEGDLFLNYYDNSPTFLHVSSDGRIRNYEEFKRICIEYYNKLKQQSISTITKKFNVLDPNLVIFGWTGNIIARFNNGDTMKMNDYSITNVFKKIGGKWKIIHSHESALPSESVKKA